MYLGHGTVDRGVRTPSHELSQGKSSQVNDPVVAFQEAARSFHQYCRVAAKRLTSLRGRACGDYTLGSLPNCILDIHVSMNTLGYLT